MCRVLKIPRSTYYYEKKTPRDESQLSAAIEEIFEGSRKNYGTRKIKKELERRGEVASRRKIAAIMNQKGLLSRYTVAKYKPAKLKCNEEQTGNLLKREFTGHEEMAVVVSDLTYVRVGDAWNYICVLVDLHNRELVGYSCGKNKDSELVKQAFARVRGNLSRISVFHTDRGSEFKNKAIDEALSVFAIKRSLSKKGCPYDNAVAEATFKIVKTEFVNGRRFENLKALELQLSDYVNWFNNHRLHSTLGYLSPAEFKKNRHVAVPQK